MLHSFASKLFKVPQRLLIEAETNRKLLVPKSVLDAVYDSRKRAKISAAVAASALSFAEQDGGDSSWPKPSRPPLKLEKVVKSVLNGAVEYADPEYLCGTCLPVYGDEIVGTKPEGVDDATPKVHRIGCPHAQRAINRALAENRRPAADIFNFGVGQRVDSVSLRRSVKNGIPKEPTKVEIPVKLRWADLQGPGEQSYSFPCEVVVHAEDRKLLLADCSEVVSELSEILKTGSQTTNETATLVFLIQVYGLADLQKLMDSLRQIPSVMAVERRVSVCIVSFVRFFQSSNTSNSNHRVQFGAQLFDVSLP
jgi:(p)ppGpp synthase/HD superfamily hydrolase